MATARSLGLPAGRTLWYDLEGGFDLTDTDCRRSALRFLSGWTLALHGLGYRSGVYSSIADGIHALDNADNLSPGSYAMPDQVWFAWYNNHADVRFNDKVRATSWVRQRVHQYAQNQSMTFGGVTLAVDPNYVDVGGGSVAPAAPKACGGVRIDLLDYPNLARGKTGPAVKALQCLLKQRGKYRKPVDGRYDADVHAAVRAYQRSRSLPVTGRMVARTWVSLLSHGAGNTLLKECSTGDAVRRLQRALNVAPAADLRVTGVLDRATSTWLRRYQVAVGLANTGVVAAGTWEALRRGRL